jgi:hypothetical protein
VQTVLYTRRTFEKNIRWNESLTSAQDWEMHIRLAMAGVSYCYLPGCFSVIRCPPVPTVSTRNPRQMEENILGILKDAEARLKAANRLNERYRRAMAGAYLALACGANQYFDRDRSRFEQLVQQAERLSPTAVYPCSPFYTLVGKTLGVRNAEWIRSVKRRWLKSLWSEQPTWQAAKK